MLLLPFESVLREDGSVQQTNTPVCWPVVLASWLLVVFFFVGRGCDAKENSDVKGQP